MLVHPGGGATTFAALTDKATVDLPGTNAPLATALAALVPKAGGTMTGPLVLSGDASAALNPVSLQQMQAAVIGVGKRARARVTTTANITISTALVTGQVLNGVTLAAGDLVLVKDQSTGAQNGVYVAGATPARAAEFDTWAEFPGSLVAVYEGTVNPDTLWFCTNNDGGTLGTTAIVFQQFSVAGALLAVNNLSDVANAATARSNIAAAPIASPTFTGTPASTTNASATDASTQIATDAFVQNAIVAAVGSGNGLAQALSFNTLAAGSGGNGLISTLTVPAGFPKPTSYIDVECTFLKNGTTDTAVTVGLRSVTGFLALGATAQFTATQIAMNVKFRIWGNGVDNTSVLIDSIVGPPYTNWGAATTGNSRQVKAQNTTSAWQLSMVGSPGATDPLSGAFFMVIPGGQNPGTGTSYPSVTPVAVTYSNTPALGTLPAIIGNLYMSVTGNIAGAWTSTAGPAGSSFQFEFISTGAFTISTWPSDWNWLIPGGVAPSVTLSNGQHIVVSGVRNQAGTAYNVTLATA